MVIRKNIIGYEGLYMISNTGSVKSIKRQGWNGKAHYNLNEYILKSAISKSNGYKTVVLCKNGKTLTHRIHRLVTFKF